MRILLTWFYSRFGQSRRQAAPLDLPTRIVRVMSREGGIACADFLSVTLMEDSKAVCAAMHDLIARGVIRESAWQAGTDLRSGQVVYALGSR